MVQLAKRLLLVLMAACQSGLAQTAPQLWISPSGKVPNYWELFKNPHAWPTVQETIDVFSMHVNRFKLNTPFDTVAVQQAIRLFNARDILVAFEVGGLRPFSGCDDRAGEKHAALEGSQMAIWLAQGGRIDLITMDSAINTMIANGKKGNCGWTVTRAAHEMVDYMEAIRAMLPDVQFGLIEPVPWYSVGSFPSHPGNHYGDLPAVLDTVLTVVQERGETLDYFYADSPYDYSDNSETRGWLKLKAVEDYVREKGLRFGLVYNSSIGGNTSDQLFYEQTLDGWVKYAAVGGQPDIVGVWSWYPHPSESYPEDQPYTFTYTCKAFFEQAGLITAVPPPSVPQAPALLPNYPNPFNPSTTIRFVLARPGLVRLRVFDLLGKEVASLLAERLPAGPHAVVFDAGSLPSGVYFYQLQADQFKQTRRLLLRR